MSDNPLALTAEQAIKQTYQALPDAQHGGANLLMWSNPPRGPLLPAWGTRERERALRWLYRADYNWMVQGAFAGIMNTVASTKWGIRGPDAVDGETKKYYRHMLKALGKEAITTSPDIEYWQALLRGADFGRGWTSFIRKGVDFLRQDSGWFIEVIAPGDPMKEPTGAVVGLAHLDALHCIPTGDPTYPVIYFDSRGGYHLLHHTRVIQLQDMPDGDETRPGYGLCALSRAVSIASQGILMGRYIESKLDDKPAPGINVFSGMISEQLEASRAMYRAEQANDEMPPWGRQLNLFSIDPALPIKVENTAFSVAPDKFDYKQYVELNIDALALAIGVDKSDLWQMTTGSMGSSGQAQIAAQKSRGKTIGVLRTELERTLNDLMPDEYEFYWEAKDPQEEQEKATSATTWAGVATSLKGTLGAEEIRQLLATTVPEIKDAITDEQGNIRTVDDAGIQPPQQLVIAPPPTAEGGTNAQPDATLQSGGQPPKPGGIVAAVRKRSRRDDLMGGLSDVDTAEKAIQATRLDFENAFSDLVTSRVNDEITGQRFGILARAMLKRYGLQALRDGLEDGGVRTTDESGILVPLEPDEQAAYDAWLMEQSAYVSNFGKTLTKGEEPNGDARAEMWFNKSVYPIYQTGVISADKNGMYEWFVGMTEHCADCKRLDGQVHRLRNYVDKGWMPKSQRLECGGWRCECFLKKTNKPITGGY